MKTSTAARCLPVLAVAALLALALFAPSRRAGADRSLPQSDYLHYPVCTPIANGGVGTSTTYDIQVGEGITQPLGNVGNLAACSLDVADFQNKTMRWKLISWDPATLAPATGSIALQTRWFSTTLNAVDVARQDLYPPYISQSLGNVAEAPPSNVAVEWRLEAGQAPEPAKLVANDASGAPAALRILSNGTRTTIPGGHPVFVHSLCGGDADLQSIRVVQSVATTNTFLDPSSYQYVQKFRVPVATTARWVELAFAQHFPQSPLEQGLLMICDASGEATPPQTFSRILAFAYFSAYTVPPLPATWASHGDFAQVPTLEPFHDYWLVVTTQEDYSLYGKQLTGSEGPYFTNGVRGLYRRFQSNSAAVLLPGYALSFRIMGTPVGNVGVPPLAMPRATFELAVAPNPARGAASLTWRGARGGVRFEVLDARGRRVAQGMSAQGEAGRWSWNAAGDDGRALPAGLYFVRARDEAGRSTSARVTVVR